MKLHEYPEEFRMLITLVSGYMHLPESAVERDYYIVMLLKNLADSEYAEQCVFKGGTSLSKCYPGSIERFSEDIDLTFLGMDKSDKVCDKTIKKIENIVTNNEKQYAQLLDEKNKSDELVNTKIILENKDVLDIYDIKKQLEKLPNRKIWLKCGGFITIDKTEALTAIDVNTGKYTGNKSLRQTILRVNQEATIEIAKQLRLRDIGGIIIIDYIDMKNQEDREIVEELLKEELKKDRTKTQVEGFTKLDLMEMTRKHICSHKDRKENI